MTITPTTKLSEAQAETLAEIVSLTDEGFKYSLPRNHKRLRTLQALERRDLLRLEEVEATRGAFIRAYPTPYGRFILRQYVLSSAPGASHD